MSWGGIARVTAEGCVISMMILMIVTMHQLGGSIQIVLKKITVRQAKCINCISLFFGILALGAFSCTLAWLITNNSKDSYVFILYSTSYSLIAIVYSVTILWLIRKLNKITTDGLAGQKQSVKRQFWVFFIAFCCKGTYYFSQIYVDNADYFLGAMIGGTINVIWNAFPITYMLMEQRKTFQAQLSMRRISLASNGAAFELEIDEDEVERNFRSKKIGFSFTTANSNP